MDANEILEIESNYKTIFQDKQEFIKVVEDLYLDDWIKVGMGEETCETAI